MCAKWCFMNYFCYKQLGETVYSVYPICSISELSCLLIAGVDRNQIFRMRFSFFPFKMFNNKPLLLFRFQYQLHNKMHNFFIVYFVEI